MIVLWIRTGLNAVDMEAVSFKLRRFGWRLIIITGLLDDAI